MIVDVWTHDLRTKDLRLIGAHVDTCARGEFEVRVRIVDNCTHEAKRVHKLDFNSRN